MRAPPASSFVERGRSQEVEWETLAHALAAPDGRAILVLCGSRLSHACHVLDEQLDDEARARPLARFRAVRVDADVSPDIASALQNLAGLRVARWPLWALLSPSGTPLTVSTRLDPADDLAATQPLPLTVPVAGEGTLTGHRHALERRRDPRLGGFLPTPKLLPWPALEWLYRAARIEWAGPFVERTLAAVAEGGLFDPLGGGVYAASVDERWVVPLYEKRALDQAAAISGLRWADGIDARLPALREEMVAFCLDSLLLPDGGFAAGYDADSGPYDHAGYYTFSEAEAREALDAESFAVTQRHFDLYGRGELPSSPTRNVLYRANSIAAIAQELSLPLDEVERRVQRGTVQLARAQAERARPPRDEAMAVDANAALAHALLGYDGARADEAQRAALGALERLYELADGERLAHRKETEGGQGDAPLGEWLDDVAWLGRASLAAFSATGQPRHLACAVKMHSRLAPFFVEGALYATTTGWARPYGRAPIVDGTGESAAATAVRFCVELAQHHPDAAELARAVVAAHLPQAYAIGVEGCGLLLAAEADARVD